MFAIIFLLILIPAVYFSAMAFTLLLLGLRILHCETSLSQSVSTVTSTAGSDTSLIYHQESPEKIQKNIASQVIRLHVIANSDTAQDQALKLKVRNAIIEELQSSLTDTGSYRMPETRSSPGFLLSGRKRRKPLPWKDIPIRSRSLWGISIFP